MSWNKHSRQTRITAMTLCLGLSITANSAEPVKDLCAGLITDKLSHPMPKVAKPAHLAAFKDPVFGSTVRRITNASSGEIIKPIYSTIQAWNADESYLILWDRNKGHQLYDGKTYKFIRQLDINPADLEQVYWDFKKPNILYFVEHYHIMGGFPAGNRLIRYEVSSGKAEVLKDFMKDCKNNELSSGGDPMGMSWDSNVIGLKCGSENNTNFFYYKIGERETGPFVTPKMLKGAEPSLAPQPTPSGKRFYMQGRVLDEHLIPVRQLDLANSGEHASLGRFPNGEDGYFAVTFDGGDQCGEGSLVAHNLENGSCRVVIGEVTGWPYPPTSTHVSAIAHRNPGWVGVSSVGDPESTKALHQEIYLAYVDDKKPKVCRVAHHHSYAKEGKMGYWSEPHVVISPSGTRLLFASDWDNGKSVDTYVVELPAYNAE